MSGKVLIGNSAVLYNQAKAFQQFVDEDQPLSILVCRTARPPAHIGKILTV
jgi:hypothetical protein